ncbi:hypothetical protein AAFF_G00131600 [Aldrovandia affinis]|uniref:Cortactin-binding protein 2 n=1 Tax=Aldrovandia affinis TaxID=143900 RepID=A0AAD7RR19_9TELE|nr:hypothetical protein AAFF_G00131600 [Aldrovandia affinis]
MATDGAGGEQSPPVQTLATAVRGSIELKCEFNMENLSKPELLTLLSIMEGELEARDLVIEALRARRKDAFIQERYGHFSLADPFLALQRDVQCGGGAEEQRAVCASPVSVLEAVMAHCKNMQERMSAQLAAAESRQKKLEQEKTQLQSLQQEHRKLTAQLKDEREKNKHMVSMLVRECKQLAARAVEEGQKGEELSTRLQEEGRASGALGEELRAERQKGQQMEAEMEKQLSELDTEREQLRARLSREEARSAELREETEALHRQLEELRTERDARPPSAPAPPRPPAATPKATVSVAVGTDPVTCRVALCQTDPPPAELSGDGLKKGPASLPAKPSPANYAGMSLPKSAARGPPQAENGPPGPDASQAALPTGISPRVQAARYKFQAPAEQDQNGTAALSPPSRGPVPHQPGRLQRQAARPPHRHPGPVALHQLASGGRPAPRPAPLRLRNGPFPGPPGPSGPPGRPQVPHGGEDRPRQPPAHPAQKAGPLADPLAPPPMKAASGAGALHKPATPQLPPKPAMDLAGRGGCSVPALAAASSSDSTLAAASGWCPSIVPSLTCGDPVSLEDGRTPLLQAAPQGNVTLLSMLLNHDPTDISHPEEEGNAALYSAAENGHTDCVKLLLAAGVPAELPDKKGFTPLHMAAAQGQSRCVEVLAETALFLASGSGNAESVKALLDAGADRTLVTTDGWTTLHAAASVGHVSSLELLLYHPDPAPIMSARPCIPPSTLLNHSNRDGWTAAHIAASNGFKNCLEVLCGHSWLDFGKRDKCNRTVHDVATDDCKNLLENLHSYRVLIRIQRGSEEQICTMDLLEDGPTVGTVTIHRSTAWAELSQSLTRTLSEHFLLLSRGGALGLSTHSVSSVLIGDAVWHPSQALSLSPWDLIRKRHCQHITVRLKGLSESSLEELAYDTLIPLQLFQNYIRLVEQYRNIIFHGFEGSCQEYIANQISHCIKHKQEAMGIGCDIVRVEVDENMSREQLVETFINCGFLVPVTQSVVGVCVVVLLEGLEKAHSLSELLGDLCQGLENRGCAYPLPLLHAQDGCNLHHFHEGGFLIGTLSRPHLHGAELLLQQHFRWIQLRWDSEPLSGLLTRHLSRKLVHKMRGQEPSDLLSRTVGWVCTVWQQLNSCLCRLGAPEALIGPQLFLSCPIVPEQPQAVFKWLSRLWNVMVVPRVEEAIISRVTMKRSPAQRQSPSNKNLSAGQQAVVKAALSILVNKAILQGCPLRTEIDAHLSEFQGSSFPLSVLGSHKGGAKKGQDGIGWKRKASTSPRKKGSPAPTWRASGTLRGGSLSNTELCFSRIESCSQRVVAGEPVGFPLCSGEEADLMQELQTMCSSRSEPDISKIVHSQEDLALEETTQPQALKAGRHHSIQTPGPPCTETRTAKSKSQLPVRSSNLHRSNSTLRQQYPKQQNKADSTQKQPTPDPHPAQTLA